MKLKELLFSAVGIIFVLLISCSGGGDVLITIHEVDKQYMAQICDEDYICVGYAKWDYTFEQATCDIYMLPMSDYGNDQTYYEEVLGHETRHCFERDFH